MADFQRLTAKKCQIIDIIRGRYVKKEGWEPNYIVTPFENISRVNILGIVVSKISEKNLLLDDGTEKISVRVFENENLLNIPLGSTVLIIGKPRMFNEETYVFPEIIKILLDSKWLKVRELEMKIKRKNQNIELNIPEKKEFIKEEKKEKELTKPKKEQINYRDLILKKIKEDDCDEGVSIANIENIFGINNCETIINELLEEGEIFEIKPGKVKIL
ncbi:MAG: hypothetical protein ABIC91_06535 [Nanoarchaeota archaeon]|nr:hypothetical protein [Nanoarchaeota archaeon]MBU1030609.1 hypothetical protein [Nanoarchaeota archaeon]